MAEREMPTQMKGWIGGPMKAFQRANTLLYRMSGGKLGARLGGAPLLLLTVTGRKSGKPHTAPLIHLRDGDDYVVVASKGGWPHHPLWYQNLQANPEVTVQVGRQKLAMTARTASPSERARLWPRLVKLWADYANYQSWTDREIPVVILSPARSS
jgi:deazaflavin-dependent oxidoreductase (nitroreductase family)